MEYRDVRILPKFLRPFPSGAEVFQDEAHEKYFQALLSVDISAINPDWKETLHFVMPKEPEEGIVGDGAEAFHTYYCRANWVAFRVVDGRYEFMADFRYFAIEGANGEALLDHYEAAEDSLRRTTDFYLRHGMLNPWDQTDNPQPWIEAIGGELTEGNWCSSSDFPLADRGEPLPLTQDGRPFRYIGTLAGYGYREHGADGVLLFFDPVENIALLTFDWT